MGAVETGDIQARSFKKKGLRRPKRRIGIHIDMTPMVDIAFLLLIFYMVATRFYTPQAMEINLPPLEAEDTAIPVGKSYLINLLVDSQGRLFWAFGTDKPNYFEEERALRDSLISWNQRDPDRMVTVLKIDTGARYSRMVDLIDEIQVTERIFQHVDSTYSYRFSIVDMTQYDLKQLEEARKALGLGGEVTS
ncbi:MAG: biopolymer transporter ExbD [Candidatus Zixiibacteriota bacterium]|nr:MAG: biopolymer transporter ExbD [candidate division Zixibacteria bacterium]